ncbi:hypothetical protein P154DRAFT_21662 [Amniculicola lignicola CBS 123094]|uniref:Uncharacterized protein n=1 Tax=Amniculicola lignicola CBS 123094 TaxID=1392246 RepID=A0A6A5WTJ6_9PLEO|nr:hypothetical protein P154DRAFT_21662 [Amniculicola lignicola CBS 123094]
MWGIRKSRILLQIGCCNAPIATSDSELQCRYVTLTSALLSTDLIVNADTITTPSTLIFDIPTHAKSALRVSHLPRILRDIKRVLFSHRSNTDMAVRAARHSLAKIHL